MGKTLETFKELLAGVGAVDIPAWLVVGLVGVKEKLADMIPLHIDNGELLPQLMSLYEDVEATLAEYETILTAAEANTETSESQIATHSQLKQSSAGTNSFLKQIEIKKEEEATPLPDINCPICMDDVPGDQTHRLKECGHQYCKKCLEAHLDVLINEGQVLDIKCPNPTCNTVFTYSDVPALRYQFMTVGQVRSIITGDLRDKYEDFLVLAALKTEPNLRWCPKPGCGNAMIGSENQPHMRCNKPNCGYEFCFKCGEAVAPAT
eukprot:TRINITY_DN293_c0_g2_i3.p1 TRINITY_DN293_c0_g2~~TRINITY_DN293_c0_g2_i3.p1  ORF type:complete len:301 (+),score=81.93 TRINITY_DN293_c0_g2_i3:114-905(+)